MAVKIEDIDSPEKLEEYLRIFPASLKQVIAFRCAMRSILAASNDDTNVSEMIFKIFRANLISGMNSKYLSQNFTGQALRAAEYADKSFHLSQSISIAKIIDAAHLSAFTVKEFRDQYTFVKSVPSIVLAAAEAFGDNAKFIWSEMQSDFSICDGHDESSSLRDLLNAPLLSLDAPFEIQKNWNSLKDNLLAQNPNWQVWTDWYEHVLQGAKSPKHGIAALSDEQLIELAQKPNEFWEREPEDVNAEIAGWLPKKPSLTMAQFIVITLEKENRTLAISEFVSAFEKAGYNSSEDSIRGRLNELTDEGKIERVGRGKYALPDSEVISLEEISEPEPQSTSAVIFVDGGDDPINVDFDASARELLSDKSASDRHSEVLRLSNRMIDSYDPAERGANTAAMLIGDVKHFRDAIGEAVQDANPDFLIPRGEGLRQFLLANERRDEFSDLPQLSDKYTLGLKSVISAYNVYVSLDPILASRDEARLGPDAVKTLISPEDGQAIIARAIDDGVASDDVGSVLTEEAKVSPADPDFDNRNSRRYSESIKNFARVVLAKGLASGKFVWKHKGKFGSVSVGSFATVKWAIANEAWLLKTFAENPAMIETITQIISFLKTLPLA